MVDLLVRGGRKLGPVGHTLGIGGSVWAATKSPLAVPAALASGVLIDVDHALDFFNWYVRKDARFSLLAFHAWEFALVGLVLILALWSHPVLLAAAIGYAGHIATDHIANRLHPFAYFLSYRLLHRFDRSLLMGRNVAPLSDTLQANIPLWGQIEPLVLKVIGIARQETRP